MRKLTRREVVALALLTVAVVGVGLWWLPRPAVVPAAPRVSAEAADFPVPRIDLARLESSSTDAPAGRRNIFEYGMPPAPPESERPVVAASPPALPTPGGAVAGGVAGGEAFAQAAPQLNVKYIGTVDNGRGVKVAVLLTDRDEVLTGQAGQVIANRYRIARIGIESVDLEDVGTGQSRRIPLRGS